MRWLIVLACFASACSLLADFDPNKSKGSGGGGGASGSSGMPDAAAGSSGSGGMVDAAVDRPGDAAIDASGSCNQSIQCEDGIACTVNYCSILGICRINQAQSDSFCATTNRCVIDSCDPRNPAAGTDGCVHAPVMCGTGEVCDPQVGCVTGDCVTAEDCTPPDCCTTMRCQSNQCRVATSCGRDGNPPLCCATSNACLGCLDACP
jgi:hypothetical protein